MDVAWALCSDTMIGPKARKGLVEKLVKEQGEEGSACSGAYLPCRGLPAMAEDQYKRRQMRLDGAAPLWLQPCKHG